MSTDIISNPPVSNNLLTLAEREIAESGSELAGAYRKATRALVKYFPSGQLLYTDFNLRTLRDWIAAMLCGNCSLQTVLYYLENVAALYNKAVKLGEAPKTDAFRILKGELLSTQGDSLSRTIRDSLSSLSQLAKGRFKLNSDMQYYADLLLFSFYGRGLSVSAMLNITDKDLEGMPAEAVAIADRYRSKRRERIFPKGAVATVEQRTKMIAHHIGLDTPPDMTVGEITTRLWILAALRLGIPAGVIAQCGLSQDADIAILNFAKSDSDPLTEEERERITKQVAESVTYNPERWHVMKLRAHHTYEEVAERLKGPKFKHIEYFYPQEEISHRVGKRLEFEQKAIIPYVVFFRSKDTDIAPMFKTIGDIAWCYRNTRYGSYAVISRPEMDRFQRTIGNFTPDYDLQPLGTSTVGIGERVRVTGGPMAGYEGEVFDIADPVTSADATHSDQATRLFQLRLFGDNGIEWKATIDERQLEPLDV